MSLFLPNTKFEGDSTVLQRLGLVVWWGALSVIALCGIGAAIALIVYREGPVDVAAVAGIPALIFWAIG